jgi:hypothetical protein
MVLIDLVVLGEPDDDGDGLNLGMGLELIGLALHPQLANDVFRLALLVASEGADVDVEELVREAGEEEPVPLEFEVLLEVLGSSDYLVVIIRVQKIWRFLQVL